jgi:FMN phosphatase YigB (HAD superfamily)
MRAREFSHAKKDLVIFDIDDTLLHTTAKIRVVKDGRPVRELTNQQFNQYELGPGEQFDFGEFRSAEKFNQESQPIEPMIRKLKTILAHSATSKVIMLTARADFDNRELFLKTFTDLGIDMSRVHVHRAGNLPGDSIPAEKKAVYVRRYADTGLYDHIRLYDDSMSNLRVFKDLKKEYPGIDFRAYYVGPTGTTEPINESVSIKHHKKNFVSMFEKFLPLAMEYIGIDRLPTIKFTDRVGDADQPTFGRYANGEHVLEVALMNRHPNDILRTIAHELTHYKQDTEHQLDSDSGRTGSPIENEANAVAGIVMRHFNKQYPEYLSSKPITESKIQYGTLTRDNMNLIIDKSQSKADGIYSFRGILFRVQDGKVTHYASGGKIYAGFGVFLSQIGSYDTNAEARTELKSIQ